MSEPDHQLIAEFNAQRSEDAFAALVRQHVNLVFATALRQVGDAGAAEEITQNVFVALAQAAGKLGSHPTIAGWLQAAALLAVTLLLIKPLGAYMARVFTRSQHGPRRGCSRALSARTADRP